ncbi:MAG: hypothetical protein CMH91_10680 [Oceanicaulis sp.]|nr:hypothetical protein [Oceanicaulis sp.]MBG35005.1 hypothetical protein [Oceanicaulis sp.]HBU63208.1 hypothetical protein [Oceanicaulis sp.]
MNGEKSFKRIAGNTMAVRSKRKSQAWLVRIRDCSAKAFVLGVLGLAVILFPLALTSGSVWALWYF